MRARHRVTTADWLCIATAEIGAECENLPAAVPERDIETILAAGGQPLCSHHVAIVGVQLARLHEGDLIPLPPGMVPSHATPLAGASIVGVCQALQLSGGSCPYPALIVDDGSAKYLSLVTCPHHTLSLGSWIRATVADTSDGARRPVPDPGRGARLPGTDGGVLRLVPPPGPGD